jgi:hypothetical protein
MVCNHSSNTGAGRALSAGNDPMMPALHCSITNAGVEIMNNGEPTTGRRNAFCRLGGKDMNLSLELTVNKYQIRNSTAVVHPQSIGTLRQAQGERTLKVEVCAFLSSSVRAEPVEAILFRA